MISAAPDMLWAMLTDKTHLAGWWGYATLDPIAGGAFREVWNNGEREVVTSGTVTEIEPPRCLAMTWADDDWPGATRLSLTITSQPDGTCRLDLAHEGWSVLPPEKRRRLISDHENGWKHHLGNLAAYTQALPERS